MRKSTNNNLTNKDFIVPSFENAVPLNLGYGLDTSNPNFIKYSKEGITIEAIGNIEDGSPQKMLVTLRVYKSVATNPNEIYRTSNLDLFNDGRLDFTIQKISERLKVESITIKDLCYEFVERLDNYRRHGKLEEKTEVHVTTSIIEEAKKVLKSKILLEDIQTYLKRAGVSDARLGLQLFILSLSRDTIYPLHGIFQCTKTLGNFLINEFLEVLPPEQTIEHTSISKHALSYSPTEDYWTNKTLVLHQLDDVKNNGNTLLEYLMQGKTLRLVTQTNKVTGKYESEQKNVTESINLISYTEKDYHSLFGGKQTLCIPIQNKKQTKDNIYTNEVKKLAGLVDEEDRNIAIQVLQQIAREIKQFSFTNPVIEEVDLSILFGNNFTELSKYLTLVNLITLLHQKQLNATLTKASAKLEVTPIFMLKALELFRECFVKEDAELYFNVASTFNRMKIKLQQDNPSDFENQTFKISTIRKQLDISPITLGNHFKTLELYGKIQRVGGNKKTGFTYKVMEWDEDQNNSKSYIELIEEIKKIA
jgi:hypothetical protein